MKYNIMGDRNPARSPANLKGMIIMPLSVRPGETFFRRDGNPFFWLADTVWSAFSKTDDREWDYYLEHRQQQGFNTLQINVLTQWDSGLATVLRQPFFPGKDDRPDYTKPNLAYFEHAAAMTKKAVSMGFVPALVMLWCGAVPDTWLSKQQDGKEIIPFEQLPGVLDLMLDYFGDCHPVWVVSGDTDFSSGSTAYYKFAMDYVRERQPESLLTLHLNGGNTVIPEELVQRMDCYLYQSSHDIQGFSGAYKMAEAFGAYPPKPLINSEPPYEAHSQVTDLGRYSAAQVRCAGWQSVLAGASAGVTYGAHGVWGWMQPGEGMAAEYSGLALPALTALQFPGAWDYGYIRHVAERLALYGMRPARELLEAPLREEIQLSTSADDSTLLLYLPCEAEVTLNGRYRVAEAHDLENRRILTAQTEWRGDKTVIGMPWVNGDLLYVLVRDERG